METLKAKKKNGQMDFLLYVTVLLLCAFGLVMVFSASYYYAQNKASLNYDGLYYLKNQAKYMAMGLGVMIVMSRVDYHYLEKLRNVGLMVTLLLMLATVFWGEDINGAKRWLNLFDVITFQPSELAKFVLILYMASFMTRRTPQMKSFTRGIVPMLIIMCIICILLLLQKNMSMMMVVMMIGFVMLFLGGADMRHLVGLCLLPCHGGGSLPAGGAGVLSCGVDGNVPLEQVGNIHKPMERPSGKRLSADTVPVRIGQRRSLRQGA